MKASFDLPQAGPPAAQSHNALRKILLAVLAGAGALYYLHGGCGHHGARAEPPAPSCPQVESRTPSKHNTILEDLNALYDTPQFKDTIANWMSGAVQIPTESYDEMEPVGHDKRYEVFGKLHDYLHKAFPKVHDTLTLTRINTYGLLYHWDGSDKSLKPLLLTGHQDVVPVEPETVGQWKYPPYSGHYDGDYVHGRGSVDDKSTVISILATLESLIERGFTPRRTIVLSFGFDEESSGKEGALQLAKYLEQTYGRDAFAMLVDEGSAYSFEDGVALAAPGTSEKGYIDLHFDVNTPGGHSSIPPEHTGIGLLANLIVALEKHAPVPSLRRESAIYSFLQCMATHDLPLLPPAVRKDLLDSRRHNGALRRAERALLADPTTRSMLGTTQAVDIVKGGVKINALPETVKAVVNYRIDAESSVKEVQKHVLDVITPLAKKFNLSLNAFGEDVRVTGGDRAIIISDAWGSALEPAPVTPTGKDGAPYELLSGTIQAAFHRGHISHDLKKAVVAPAVLGGNTDTQRYWNLTKHIFRYSHVDEAHEAGGEHTVNEAIRAVGLVDYARFFGYLILNVDETTEF